jgi:hypothetical protein
MTAIKQRIEDAAGARFNSLLANLCRDGRDAIGFHSDAELDLDNLLWLRWCRWESIAICAQAQESESATQTH